MLPVTISKYSDEWFLGLYLKYGSVEETVRSHPDSLPISIANYHRMVRKYGLVKSAGRHVSLPETLHFFRAKALSPNTPLERIYKQMPLSFKTSLSTLHRIYQHMERQAVRRNATALIISREEDRESILLGSEVFGNSRYGKHVGDFSLPMSFAKAEDSNFDSVLRVLQQEVYSGLAQRGLLKPSSEHTRRIINEHLDPFSYFDIVDVRVKIFHLSLPKELGKELFSYKLTNHEFRNINDLEDIPLRAGVSEMVSVYSKYLYNPYTVELPAHVVSSINLTPAFLEA